MSLEFVCVFHFYAMLLHFSCIFASCICGAFVFQLEYATTLACVRAILTRGRNLGTLGFTGKDLSTTKYD